MGGMGEGRGGDYFDCDDRQNPANKTNKLKSKKYMYVSSVKSKTQQTKPRVVSSVRG